MELNIIEEKKNRIKVEIKGEGHGFCNALKEELWNDKGVKVAGYNIKHPLIGVPVLIVETTQGTEARKALLEAAKRVGKSAEKFKAEAVKELK